MRFLVAVAVHLHHIKFSDLFLVIKINYIMTGFTTYNFDTVGGLSIVQWNCNCLILHRSELICHCYEECA